MTKAGEGNAAAFQEVHDRYRDRAYRVAWSVCYDNGRAEDAVQEAFLAIWRSSASYSAQRGTVAAWVLTVVRNRAIDVARRNVTAAGRDTPDTHLDGRPGTDDVDQQIRESEEHDRLQRLLSHLPDAQHEVITLAFYGQLTHTEITERLNLPTGTVKGRIRLGMDKLRADLTAIDQQATPRRPDTPRRGG